MLVLRCGRVNRRLTLVDIWDMPLIILIGVVRVSSGSIFKRMLPSLATGVVVLACL